MKTLIRLILVFLVLAVFGCATAKKTYDSSGRESYIINCDGTALDWGSCLKKAGELCGAKGYDIIEQHDDRAYVFGAPSILRSMQITCK